MTTKEFLALTPRELASRRDSGELWQIVDVREPWEVNIASVSDAVSIPMADIPRRANELDAGRPVAVLCHSGMRSAHVASWLVASGFATVANVEGGIDAWSVELDPAIPRY